MKTDDNSSCIRSAPPSIATALNHAVEQLHQTSARLEAEILLAFCLQQSRTYLRTWPERRLEPQQWQQYQGLIQQRHEGKPIAYIVGRKEFWSMDLQVSEATLIPRPETERLVELALDRIPNDAHYTIADLGCGSGAIGLALAKERSACHIIATDTSAAALRIAQSNAHSLGIKNVSFVQAHWLNPFASRCFDLIVSNPPYIAPDDPHLHSGDLIFEPPTALRSDNLGLQDLSTIIRQGGNHLKPGAWLLLEHGYNQARDVCDCLTQHGFQAIQCERDYSGNDRVCMAQYSAQDSGNPK
ncbi:MAG: peptide chain release factor N(5)-glutamine methyltransferase [Gammaproteobacteria bacterium]|nr:peptide chain release factor N(5)-glutamine methyltransferase [Gammaproteobacteria bacterium]MDH5801987.1 peptide chain release factor N(5)-glutamine methyltransferase [Gammaproteobacteria bacterium]